MYMYVYMYYIYHIWISLFEKNISSKKSIKQIGLAENNKKEIEKSVSTTRFKRIKILIYCKNKN